MVYCNIWCGCAGEHGVRPLKAVSKEHIDTLLHINFKAPLLACKEFLKRQNSDATSIRNYLYISSIAQKIGEPGLSVYSGSKAAMTAAICCLAIELANKNILVNSISPGWVETSSSDRVKQSMTDEAFSSIESRYPLGLGQTNDVAGLAGFLVHENRWITGQDYVIDGGRVIL